MIQLPTPPLVDFGAHTVNMDIPAKFVIKMEGICADRSGQFLLHVTVAYFPFSDVPIKLTLDGSNVHACNGLSIVQ